jgi:hypothetical protein
MKNKLIQNTALLITGFVFGAIVTNLPNAQANINSNVKDISKKEFSISIDEVKQNIVFGERFTQSYQKTIELSDGSQRTIELTPMIRNGMQVVEFKDTGGRTYMGLNGTTTNGSLMVKINDVEANLAELKSQGWNF